MNDDRIFPIKQELPTNFNLSLGNYEAQNKALTIDRMSTNIILIMEELAKNEEIFRLLSFLENPFGRDLDTTKIKEDDLITAKEIFDKKLIIKQSTTSNYTKINPMPFNPEVQSDEECFIRVYYAEGLEQGLEGGTIYIDIICSSKWWLTEDLPNKNALIRPYAIASRVKQTLDNKNNIKIGKQYGYKHFMVNKEFDSIRLYYYTQGLDNKR